MGMPITIEVIGSTEEILTPAFEYLRHIDEVFSTYKAASQISRLNRGELTGEQASAEVQQVLAECARYKTATQGFFDIARPQGGIDPSGLVKGWAIQGAADLIAGTGAKNFFVSAGGDVQTVGHNAQGQPWRVGITNPFEPKQLAKQVQLSGQAIATSGSYERGAHIYNPHTGKPADELVSLSVIGPSIYETDVLATAVFVMGQPGLKFLTERGYEAMMITAQQAVVLTPGFGQYEVS